MSNASPILGAFDSSNIPCKPAPKYSAFKMYFFLAQSLKGGLFSLLDEWAEIALPEVLYLM